MIIKYLNKIKMLFRHNHPGFSCHEHRQLVEDYREDYEDQYLLPYPEFCVDKLNLDTYSLNSLPPASERNRNQVINWMIRNLTYQNLLDAGW
tara:strand:- start:124 stop:399 length:276 start_codon:yes stop_codon:yes gene_type:complete